MAPSLATGVSLGLLLVLAPTFAGDTAVTDPGVLGAMWFMRPRTLLVLLPPLLHLGVGAALGLVGQVVPWIRTTPVVLGAVAINAAATLLENAHGAGVMGVGWWLLGSMISAALMLLGVAAIRFGGRALRDHQRVAPSKP
jgi:hypothetical protein